VNFSAEFVSLLKAIYGKIIPVIIFLDIFPSPFKTKQVLQVTVIFQKREELTLNFICVSFFVFLYKGRGSGAALDSRK